MECTNPNHKGADGHGTEVGGGGGGGVGKDLMSHEEMYSDVLRCQKRKSLGGLLEMDNFLIY